tara:strand:+ start:16514 stop:17746 length:1233 start_codon:yes stop_codon:yes gene_type:complete
MKYSENTPFFADATQVVRVSNVLKTLRKPSVRTNKAIILTNTSPGSVGDEAMVQATVQQLTKRELSVDLMVINNEEDWSHIDGFSKKVALSRFNTEDLSYIHTLSTYDEFYLVGADVLDGFYDELTTQWLLWLCYIASKVCKKTSILGFSFNQNPTKGSLYAFANFVPKSVKINIRDTYSLSRFKSKLNNPATLVADVALLLEARSDLGHSEACIAWISAQKKENKTVIGLNISGHIFEDKDPQSRKKKVSEYARTIYSVLEKTPSLAYVFIPHDTRPSVGDYELVHDLYTAVGKLGDQSRTYFLEPPLYAAGIKAICVHLNSVIVARMHLAIAALGSGTPVFSITYQGKFEGLYNHFGLSNLTSEPSKIFIGANLNNATQQLINNETSLRSLIKKKLPYVRNLSLKNFT